MDPFASSYGAVEQFNPQRYYAETGVPSSALPTGTTGPSGSQAAAPLSTYIPFVVIVLIVWAIERNKFRWLKKVGK